MNKNSNIEVSEVYRNKNLKKESILLKGFVFWLEKVKSRDFYGNSIFVRPFNANSLPPQNLIGSGFSFNSFFHGYGGNSFQCIESDGKILLIWFDQVTKSLWMQMLKEFKSPCYEEAKYLEKINSPTKLTNVIDGNVDNSFALISKRYLVGILENNETDYLFSVDITETNQKISILKKFENFAGNLSTYAGNSVISFIEWNSSDMPWENNELVLISFNKIGQIEEQKKFEKNLLNSKKNISFFQPYWLDENNLVCSEDSTGYWNLLFLEINDFLEIHLKKRFIKDQYDYGVPQWISGISLFSGTKENFFCLTLNSNIWKLEQYKNLDFFRHIQVPYTYLESLSAEDDKLIFTGANFVQEEVLVELDTGKENKEEIKNYVNYEIADNFISQPQSFWFKGYKNRKTHSWIYMPRINFFEKPPLLLKAHSGPTSRFNGFLNKEVQFWTSRGWVVAEVNYGGSSGFGTNYRQRLDGAWGVCDSQDCINLAKDLINRHLVDPSKLVICGNSAGGFTAINSLYNGDIFKAAICKYPVLDLNEMHANTHRFERYYLNSLIGKYQQNLEKFSLRSPINNIEKIKKPILIFHGKKDSVISYHQSLKMHNKLLDVGVYSEIKIFEDEGHGFKSIKTKINVLDVTNSFIKKIFGV